MTEISVEDEFDEPLDDEGDKADLRNLQEELLEKCKRAGIEAELRDGFDQDKYVVVHMPNGREKRSVAFSSADVLRMALELDFERYVFLGDYIAVANYQEGSIEGVVRPLGAVPRSFLFRRLFGDAEGNEAKPIVLSKPSSSVRIEIGQASDVMTLLARGPYGRQGALSVRLLGVSISQHDKALSYLRRVTDSMFFEIDMHTGLALSLIRDRRPVRRPGARRLRSEFSLEFPRIELDEGPASLYWYARSAAGMPLLQFLAFYQVIEYYFPAYAQEEARRRIRAILKDPTFRIERDADIGRVLSVMAGSRRGFGDERSQLRATLHACLDPEDLRRFFAEDEERERFFSAKQKGLTDHKLPISAKDADLRVPVADLIYDIRCKIVHTKGESTGGEVELLLPFSREAELLFHDIELMQYVARQVLVVASAPMSI